MSITEDCARFQTDGQTDGQTDEQTDGRYPTGEPCCRGRALDKGHTSVSGDPGLLGMFSINTVKDLPRVNSSQTSTPNDHLSTTHAGRHTLELQLWSYVTAVGYFLHSSCFTLILQHCPFYPGVIIIIITERILLKCR